MGTGRRKMWFSNVSGMEPGSDEAERQGLCRIRKTAGRAGLSAVRRSWKVKGITKRDKQTVRFLKWVKDYPGWWYLICTPADKHMNMSTMKMLVKRLAQEQFYEIIFVLLMVHRNEEYVKSISEFMLAEMTAANWDGKAEGREGIIKNILECLE